MPSTYSIEAALGGAGCGRTSGSRVTFNYQAVSWKGATSDSRGDVDDPPFRTDRTETIRLPHGRIGRSGTSYRLPDQHNQGDYVFDKPELKGVGRSTLAAFEDIFGGRLWLPAKELSFDHELSISVYHPSQPPDVLL